MRKGRRGKGKEGKEVSEVGTKKTRGGERKEVATANKQV